MRKIALTAIVIVIILSFHNITVALNVETHRAINKSIAKSTLNGFSLDQYIKNNLGFSQGIEEIFSGQRAEVWLELGGEYEDKPLWTLPYLRSKNHFHNPINDQGFSGIWDTGFLSGDSAIVWALKDKGTQTPGGYYSWFDVRDYFYKALTSTDKTTRDTNFAETFRGLGQLMHLIQDMSVPEHSRNDGHYLPYVDYESWVKRWVNSYGMPVPDNNKGHFFTGAISSIKSFMDTDKYTGSNPGVTAYSTIGLSEFSNANFFSDDSIFTGFTYPSIGGVELWTDQKNRQYLRKSAEGVTVEHLAAVSFLYFYRRQYFPQYNEKLPLGLDNNVYADYASLLLPRAVGYSAGLLNYFFRGNMDFTIDANNREDGVKGVKISNRFTEDMDGTFSLYYDTADTNRHLLGSWNISLASQVTSQVLSFQVPQDYYKYKYTLAFRGKMGTEQDAVAGYQYTGWREEWNNGLYGNHTWLYSDIDIIYSALWGDPYPAGGQTLNEVIGGKLIKENIRYAGNKYYRRNETLIMDAITISGRPNCIGQDEGQLYCFPYDFGEEFPIPITKNSWVNVKIDEISAYQIPPSQICRDPYNGNDLVVATAGQGITMKFDNGITLFFTIPGQESPGDAATGRWVAYIEPGKEWFYHIFTTFWNAGVEFVEPVNLLSIIVEQQLAKVCGEPPATEHRQRMVVDYIRIEERPTILQSQSIIVSP